MAHEDPAPEVTVVMPCLDEADTLETCIRKAQAAIQRAGISAEILIADNGSTDGSREIAVRCGARVVPVAEKGYGAALIGGITAARGTYVLMGDADDSYDFGEIPAFVTEIRKGYDLVQGCRLPSGGGRVLPGAMPWSHRWIGNPTFSLLARWWFRAPIHDIYCGMRIFTKRHFESLGQRCTGMEFATEMIIRSSLDGARIGEVPITLHQDGRKSHPPHLRTVRDGWRTLRFFLMHSPRWLFLVPGLSLIAAGALGYALALPAVRLGGVTFDAHTLLFSSLAVLCGYQAVLFAIFTKTFAMNEGLAAADARTLQFFRLINLERGLAVSLLAMLAGALLLGRAVAIWHANDFGALDYATTMRWVIPGVTLAALGFQTLLSSFFVSILGMKRR